MVKSKTVDYQTIFNFVDEVHENLSTHVIDLSRFFAYLVDDIYYKLNLSPSLSTN